MALKQRRVTRQIPKLVLRASVAPDTLNEEKRTVDVIWTTGARVLRGFFDQFWEELSLDPKHVRMERMKNGAPLLDSHNGWSLDGVLGVVETAKLEEGRGVATVRFAKDEAGEAVFAKVKDGIIRHISVGYQIHKLEKVEDGEGKVPVYRAVDWEPMELSVVPIAADAGSHVRSKTDPTNPCEFIQERTMKLKPKKKNPQGAKPDTRAAEEAAEEQTEDEEDGEETETEEGADEEEETDDEDAEGKTAAAGDGKERSLRVRAAEQKRILGIQRAGRTLGTADDVVQRAVKEGWSRDKFQTVALRQYEKDKHIETNAGGGGSDIKAGESAREKFFRGAQAWLFVRSATAEIMKNAKAKEPERFGKVSLDPGEFRGMTLLELARQALERNGMKTRGMSKMELAGAALGMPAFMHRAGGYQTTSDFPVLLEGTVTNVLLAQYAIVPDTWREFCAIGSVSDFRASSRLRRGTIGRLDKVLEHGEFTNKAVPDGAAEEISADTFGNIVALTRQVIVNDDLGALTSIATDLGRAAKLSIEAGVYDLLALNSGLGPTMADGNPLFDVDHDNIGTASTLAVAAIDADAQIMAAQMDQSGNEILDLKPSILLVPRGLGGLANQINQSQYDIDAVGAGLTNKFMAPNISAGLFSKIVATGRLTGTRRYLFADPTMVPTIEVVFLDGQQTPFLETREGWRIDGIEWKIRLDFGIGGVDFRGAVTNAGAP